MPDNAKLKTVLDAGHPETGTYYADAEMAAAQGHLVNLEEEVDFIDPWAVFRAVHPADYAALSATQVTTFWGLLSLGPLPMDDANVRLALADMFGGTDTLTALMALQVRAVSHFQKERLGLVQPGHIENARM